MVCPAKWQTCRRLFGVRGPRFRRSSNEAARSITKTRVGLSIAGKQPAAGWGNLGVSNPLGVRVGRCYGRVGLGFRCEHNARRVHAGMFETELVTKLGKPAPRSTRAKFTAMKPGFSERLLDWPAVHCRAGVGRRDNCGKWRIHEKENTPAH